LASTYVPNIAIQIDALALTTAAYKRLRHDRIRKLSVHKKHLRPSLRARQRNPLGKRIAGWPEIG
jgi:hypothetical protein